MGGTKNLKIKHEALRSIVLQTYIEAENMMRKLLTIIITLISSSALHAQAPDSLEQVPDSVVVVEDTTGFRAAHSFGIRAGYGVGTITFSPPNDAAYLPVYDFGIIYKRIGRPGLGIQMELNFINRAFELIARDEFEQDTAYNYTMIELPFLAHGYIGRKNGRLFLNLGPYINYRISGSKSYESGDNRIEEAANMNRVQLFGYGIAGGVGYGRKIGPGFLQLEGRYQYSIGNLYVQEILRTDFTQLQAITVVLAYTF